MSKHTLKDRKDLLDLLPSRPQISVKKKQIIPCEASLILILDGMVFFKKYHDPDKSMTLDVLGKEDVLILPAMLEGQEFYAVSHTDVKYMEYSIAELERLGLMKPQLGFEVARAMAEQSRRIVEKAEVRARQTIDEATATFLNLMAQKFGEQKTTGEVVLPAMSHQAISRYLNTSREIITGTLNKLRRKGLINYDRQSMVLKKHFSSILEGSKALA